METFLKKYENIQNEITGVLTDLIEKHKIEQEHSSSHCLPIISDDMMFNVGSGRYIIEVTSSHLIDNDGYQYYHSTLDVEDYLTLIDYLIETYK